MEQCPPTWDNIDCSIYNENLVLQDICNTCHKTKTVVDNIDIYKKYRSKHRHSDEEFKNFDPVIQYSHDDRSGSFIPAIDPVQKYIAKYLKYKYNVNDFVSTTSNHDHPDDYIEFIRENENRDKKDDWNILFHDVLRPIYITIKHLYDKKRSSHMQSYITQLKSIFTNIYEVDIDILLKYISNSVNDSESLKKDLVKIITRSN